MASLFAYQLRISWRAIHWSACAASLVMPIFFSLPAEALQSLGVLQAFWPVIGCFTFGSLVSQEVEGRTNELLMSHLTAPVANFLSLLMVGAISLLCCLVLTAVAASARVVVGPGAVLSLLPGAFYLGSMALLMGTVTHNTMAGLLLPLGFWLFDIFTEGAHTGMFSVFTHSTGDTVVLATLSLLMSGFACLRYKNQTA